MPDQPTGDAPRAMDADEAAVVRAIHHHWKGRGRSTREEAAQLVRMLGLDQRAEPRREVLGGFRAVNATFSEQQVAADREARR